jgi:hypothetical protein
MTEWQKFTADRALIHIPLPRSNSETARQMRVAAVLRLVAHVARHYVFQPVYLTEHGTEVARIIDDLGSSEAKWVRRVLLNINTKEQEVNGMTRAQTAAARIEETVRFMISSPTRAQEFQNQVYHWFQKACKLWMSIQQLDIRIECHLEVQTGEQGLRGWRPFLEPPLKDKQPAAGSQNGTSSKLEDQARQFHDDSDIAVEVWPRFVGTIDDERSGLERSGVLAPGYVLLNSHTAVASQDLRAASLDRGGGSHRAARGKQRVIFPGGSNGSTEDLSFLSQKG